MANMRYCRYRNTLLALEEIESDLCDDSETLEPDEQRAKDRILTLIKSIAEDLGITED